MSAVCSLPPLFNLISLYARCTARRRLSLALWTGAALLLAWLALAPVHGASRQKTLVIPASAGTTLPATITLTLGVEDVLVLHNQDTVALRFGPVLLAPGQHWRLPFEQVGVYPVAASAWPGGAVTVLVVEWPAPGWQRLVWRLGAFSDRLRAWPVLPRPQP
ncbi:cupredoxin domain-containing protein [Massilia sp. PWRC2]|uniref:cupredoxin domain-containing protein n=1 Tax=Massilia sp. PWRC2 TaxID=2804626 RepID=UPI003CEFDEDD